MTVYALLVGIDQYASAQVRDLSGCIQDVERFGEFLRARVAEDRLALKMLTDAQATRQNIIAGFEHLKQAGAEDVALFYYSGHGSQELAPEKFWHLEPEHLNETLVCHDSRSGSEAWDLADKELAHLLSQVSQRKPHLLVILDSCHSGSGTRDIEEGVRLAPVDYRVRPLNSYLSQDVADQPPPEGANWFALPESEHLLMAACRAEEVARERFIDGAYHGVFSYYLLDALQRTGTGLTYRDLFKQVNAMVRTKVAEQSPQLEITPGMNVNQAFLGDGTVLAHKPYFTLAHRPDEGWIIDGGMVHGLPPVTSPETTLLAVFEPETNIDHLENLAGALGEVAAIEVRPSYSRVRVNLAGGGELDPNSTYKAVVTALPLTPVIVHLEGEKAALDLVRTYLNEANDGQPSLLVAEGEAGTEELRLTAQDHRYRIRRATEAYPLAVDIPGFTKDSAHQVVQRLEHLARWLKTAELDNKTTRLPVEAIRMEVCELVEENGQQTEKPFEGSDEFRLIYQRQPNGQWRQPRLRIKFTNQHDRPLYLALLDLTESYKVFTGLLPDSFNVLKLEPGNTAFVNNGDPVYMSVPKRLWQQGMVETHDLFKVIISTAEFDATLLQQNELDTTFTTRDLRSIPRMSTLNRLMHRVQSRAVGREPEEDEDYADWTTMAVSVRTVRPQEATAIEPGRDVSLGAGVSLSAHPTLQAKARLLTAPESSRDLGNLAMPAWLRNDPAVSKPFEFTNTRGAGQPALSVLELAEINDYTAVTPEQPLKMQVAAPLADHEEVLPLGFDGEFFLPLGRVTRRAPEGVEITLERLPKPEPTRSLVGSLRIYFQKVISETIGVKTQYPRLAVVTYDRAKKKVVYNDEPDAVKAAVTSAQRVVLYIHGIIGETTGMTSSAWLRSLKDASGLVALADQYDVVLAFDYENLNTGIQPTGRALAAKLKVAGLGPGHGKTFHVVAHSMGGLVARWMIENEGGQEMVQHLFMLGTPNGGSPWSHIQDWATVALTIGLNSLAPVAWPVSIAGNLLSLTERIDVMLDEMAPTSEFLKNLAASPDPGIPYTLIAGNTSIIEAAKPANGAEESRIQRLLKRFSSQRIMHGAANLAFFKHPNDVAASVDSIKHVPAGRTPQSQMTEVACDHLSYFSSAAGLRALAEVVLAAQEGRHGI